jgi:oligosaccharide repeat unit polymerase
MKKKFFNMFMLIELPFIFVLYFLYLTINNFAFYNKVGAIFFIVWILISTFIIIENSKSNNLNSPIIIYIFTLSIFIFFLLIFDDVNDKIFRYYPYEYKNAENLSKVMILIILSLISFYIGTKLVKYKECKIAQINKISDTKKHLIGINCILTFIVLYVDFKISKNTFGTIFGRVTLDYSNAAKLSIFRLLLSLYPMVVITFYYILIKFKTRFLEKILIVSFMAFILILNFVGGNRAFILSAVIGCMALYYKKNGIKLKNVIVIALVFIVLFQSFVVLQYYRVNKGEFQINEIFTTRIKWRYDTLDVALLVIDRYPQIETFSYGESIKSLILNFIPRNYYPNKPYPLGKKIGIMVNPQDPNTVSSYAAITPIEFYTNFGFTGSILIVLIIGVLLQKFFYKYAYKQEFNINTLIYSNFISILYLTFRGDFTTKTINLLIPFVVFAIVKFFIYLVYKSNHIR